MLGPTSDLRNAAWTRRYPPLLVIAAAILLAIYTLPSALNLPQANPGQLAEYAPVPGNNNNAPPNGNIAGLGLGQGGSAEGGAGQATGGPGAGQAVPTVLDCVGNPPRQTEDPMSPPCVPAFQGDNGGGTYTGVSGREITVAFRIEGPFTYSTEHPNNRRPMTGFYDMDNPNDVNQFFMFQFLHDWETYFNRRYQTYHRHIHFWVYQYSNTQQDALGEAYTPSEATAEAVAVWDRLHPFATFDLVGTNSSSYTTYLAQHGVVDFGGLGFTQALATQYPSLYWSFPPTLDRQAQEYASYVCTRVVAPGRVSFSGNNDIGKPRVYGLLLTTDPARTVQQERQQLAVKYLKQDCNIQFKDTEYFAYSGCDCSGTKSGWGTANMARMQADGVTTIIWPGGFELEDPQAASTARWYPEWMLMGDDITDGTQGVTGFGGSTAEPNDEFSHAWIVTRQPIINAYGYPAEKPCYDAMAATDPSTNNKSFNDIDYGCAYYDDIRQLATGIQLAGPHLTPQSMNAGFHAIPAKNSTSPYQPSCFYLTGDYTCVKDAAVMWWDPNAQISTTSTPGCWRMWENGARYLVGNWPSGDVIQGKDPNDICNLYDGGEAVETGRTS